MDREKVISGLEHCIPNPNKSLHERMEENECRHAECPYGGKEYEYGMGCFWDLMSDALALLKEQEVVVRCKDCKHRPIKPNDYENGFDLGFPDSKCPCKCEGDDWYSWYPADNWFCPNGEQKSD